MELLDGYSSSLVTPFAEGGSINFEELGRLVEWTLEQGVDSVIAAGSTGEGYSLTKSEKAQVVGFVVDRVAGRVPVIGGATGANMADTLATIEEVQRVGADALMLSCPPIGRLGQSEIVELVLADLLESGGNAPNWRGSPSSPTTPPTTSSRASHRRP